MGYFHYSSFPWKQTCNLLVNLPIVQGLASVSFGSMTCIKKYDCSHIPMMSSEAQDLGTPKCVQQHIQSLDRQLIHLLRQALRPLSLLLVVNFSVLHHEPAQHSQK